jgi:2'-5' RNA ligase
VTTGAGPHDEERARLFVALELASEVVDALARWRSAALACADGLRPVAGESLHLTLCFLGLLPASLVPAIAAAVHGAAGGRALPGLSVGEALLLPARRPRVLAVGIADPAGELAALQESVAGALAARGWYALEGRPYLPHVTVARARARERVRVHAGGLPSLPPVGAPAESVTLFRSRLGGGGARYEPLARVPVAGR